MNILKHEKGITILEVIIVITIIAIGTTIAVLSINVVFRSDVKSYALEMQSDLRDVRYKTIASSTDTFNLVLNYDNTDNNYYYEVYNINDLVNPIKTVNFKKHIVLNNSIGNPLNGELPMTFSFNNVSGRLLGAPDILTIQFTSSSSSDIIELEIIGITGRIYINE